MTRIGIPMELDSSTSIIDIGYFNAVNVCSIYVIKGERSCIIDSGTAAEVPTLWKGLETGGVCPPDIIALTHSHFDHCQGVPMLRELSRKKGKEIEVVASETGVGLLADQSFNRVFDKKGRYEDIPDVKPLKEGDVIDLGGETLKVINTPGHSNDHVSYLHQESGRLYVGDSLGIYLGENSYVPPFFPASWNLEAFYDTIEKLKGIDFKQICFAHFGCISEEKSAGILDFALEQTNRWWAIYEEAEKAGKIRDYDYLTVKLLKETGLTLPDIELLSVKLRIGLKVMNGVRRIRGKEPLQASLVLMHDYMIPWLSRGYRIYNEDR